MQVGEAYRQRIDAGKFLVQEDADVLGISPVECCRHYSCSFAQFLFHSGTSTTTSFSPFGTVWHPKRDFGVMPGAISSSSYSASVAPLHVSSPSRTITW